MKMMTNEGQKMMEMVVDMKTNAKNDMKNNDKMMYE